MQAYIVVELKNTEYKPEYAGKLNFYLLAVDDLIKTDEISKVLPKDILEVLPTEEYLNLHIDIIEEENE